MQTYSRVRMYVLTLCLGVAGAAAIVREYLQKGYYPSGIPNAGDAVISPSAALLKAMLVASARPLDGFTKMWGRYGLCFFLSY